MAVAAAARRTVVVVNAATPVLMPWLDDVDAILVAGLPGQEGGHAVAAALLGSLEPTGRLVTTWPAADGATPAWSVTPDDGVLAYAEGGFIGYRGHAAGRAPEPRFWFGAGLGYGTGSTRAPARDGRRRRPLVTVRCATPGTAPPARSCRSTSPRPTPPSRSGWSAGRRRTSPPARRRRSRCAAIPGCCADGTPDRLLGSGSAAVNSWSPAGWATSDGVSRSSRARPLARLGAHDRPRLSP